MKGLIAGMVLDRAGTKYGIPFASALLVLRLSSFHRLQPGVVLGGPGGQPIAMDHSSLQAFDQAGVTRAKMWFHRRDAAERQEALIGIVQKFAKLFGFRELLPGLWPADRKHSEAMLLD